jgi:hypothetical protein
MTPFQLHIGLAHIWALALWIKPGWWPAIVGVLCLAMALLARYEEKDSE